MTPCHDACMKRVAVVTGGSSGIGAAERKPARRRRGSRSWWARGGSNRWKRWPLRSGAGRSSWTSPTTPPWRPSPTRSNGSTCWSTTRGSHRAGIASADLPYERLELMWQTNVAGSAARDSGIDAQAREPRPTRTSSTWDRSPGTRPIRPAPVTPLPSMRCARSLRPFATSSSGSRSGSPRSRRGWSRPSSRWCASTGTSRRPRPSTRGSTR